MTREERAKQFMPFDAMKGLKEALLDREERHARVERRELSDETVERISSVLQRTVKGDRVYLEYYRAFHTAEKSGTVTGLDSIYRFIKVDDECIYFDDIYRIKRIDISSK